LHAIKKLFSRYTKWIWGWLGPLGPWGVFAFAAVDASLMGLPLDAVVATYVYNDRPRLLFYVFLASAGSAVGSCVIYLIGYLGGEALLRKRIPAARYERIHASFEHHEFWALMFPAMLPPPFPFKLFVLAAAGFEMQFIRFLAAIFAGRFVRFFILAVLTLKFGPGFVHLIGDLFRHHLPWVMALAAIVVGVWLAWRRTKQQRVSP
jgi:membrane protein YqaA with SNARE-associated domain